MCMRCLMLQQDAPQSDGCMLMTHMAHLQPEASSWCQHECCTLHVVLLYVNGVLDLLKVHQPGHLHRQQQQEDKY